MRLNIEIDIDHMSYHFKNFKHTATYDTYHQSSCCTSEMNNMFGALTATFNLLEILGVE